MEIGLKFGHFTILSNKYRKHRKTVVDVECSCGVKKTVDFYKIKTGHTKSCGHLNANRMRKIGLSQKINIDYHTLYDLYIIQDLTTDQLGKKLNLERHTVESRLSEYNIKKEIRKGKRHNCWKGSENISGTYWSRILMGAKSRNLEVKITIEDIDKLFIKQNKKCAITNVELIQFSDNTRKYATASLDRIDSKKGYTLDNIQWIHKVVQKMKMELSDQEFIEWCRKVANNNPPL